MTNATPQNSSSSLLKQTVAIIEEFQTYAKSLGWPIEQGLIKSDYYQIIVCNESEKAHINFRNNGRITITGRGSGGAARAILQEWAKTHEKAFPSTISLASLAPIVPLSEPAALLTADVKQASPDLDVQELSRPLEIDSSAHTWIYEHIGPQVYGFLPEACRVIYSSGVSMLQSIKNQQQSLPEYTSLIIPFVLAYQGFIVEMALALGLHSRESLLDLSAFTCAERCFDSIIDHIRHAHSRSDQGLISTLACAWTDICNRVWIVSIGMQPGSLSSYILAEQDIYTINRAMRRGHEYLVAAISSNKVNMAVIEHVETAENNATEVTTAEIVPGNNGHTKPSCATLISPKARIGTDESGKGAYFGPLVISSVYVDVQMEEQLLALGVRDCKRLKSEQQLHNLATQIKALCPHEIYCIDPEHFNELCKGPNQSNPVLADGHAQVIARLHRRLGCSSVITDQFGPETLMLSALTKQNCQITLEQRPHAESDCAVAAASIVARATFLTRLNELSQLCGQNLPRGSVKNLIVPVGRAIFANGGLPALARVAKLYIKTTQAILED